MKMKKDKQPGIDFEKVILEKVNLEINSDFTVKNEGIPVDISFKVNRNIIKSQKLLKLSLEMSIFKETENPPLRISVLATGYFNVKRVEDIKKLEAFSHVQAPALVFPFIREIIADITMRTGYPPLLIPPTNIIALAGQTNKKAKSKTNKK